MGDPGHRRRAAGLRARPDVGRRRRRERLEAAEAAGDAPPSSRPRRSASSGATTRNRRARRRLRLPGHAAEFRRHDLQGRAQGTARGRFEAAPSRKETTLISRRTMLEAGAVALGAVAVGGVVLGEHADPAVSAPVGQAGRGDPELRAAARVRPVRRSTPRRSRGPSLTGELQDVRRRPSAAHEQEHIAFLQTGARRGRAQAAEARLRRRHRRRRSKFSLAAFKLEDLGVAAYNAQAPNLTKRVAGRGRPHRVRGVPPRRLDPRPARHEPGAGRGRAVDPRGARDRHLQGQRVRAMSARRDRPRRRDRRGARRAARHHARRRSCAARRSAARRCWPRRAAPASAAVGEPRRGDPQLRADARVRAGLVLQRGRADRRADAARWPSRRASWPPTSARTSKAFREVLGSRAVKRPRFDFRGATEDAERFRKTAVAFEDLAVAAYKGQAPLIQSRALPRPGAGASTPSRRATPRGSGAWRVSRRPPTRSTSRARSSSTLAIVADTHFVVKTRSRRKPKFTG